MMENNIECNQIPIKEKVLLFLKKFYHSRRFPYLSSSDSYRYWDTLTPICLFDRIIIPTGT